MAFDHVRKVTDEEEKFLAVASSLRTLNGKIPPTPQEVMDASDQREIDDAISLVKSANLSRRAEALRTADSSTLAAVDAALGTEPVDKP